MSAPVDVLAVLDENIRRAEERGNCERSDRLQAARTAVAELIESIPALIDIADGRSPVALGVIRRAEAALARVGRAA